LWLLTTAAPASRAQEIQRTGFEDMPSGTFGLGGAEWINTKIYLSDSNAYEADLVPLYLYEGDRFFAHGTSAGIHLLDSRSLEVNLLGRYRLTWFEPEDAGLEGVRERKKTLDAGLSATLKGRWGEVNATWLIDTLGHHSGHSAELSYRLRLSAGEWTLTPWVSYEWQSSRMTDYYFGISAAEAQASGLPEYRPGAGSNIGWGLNTAYPLTENILFFANLGQTWLDEEIHSSPIVQPTRIDSLYVGATYLMRPPSSASPGTDPGSGNWSWRLNGGYAAEGDLIGEISSGDLSRSKDIDAGIAGFTLSRLVRPGHRVEFWARGAVFRHFEDGYQDDFFSYAALLAAVGKGYLRWSDREAFRFGIGYGLSYADRVPGMEQIEQGREGDRTNRLLTYMELTLDVPLGNFFSAESVQRCYSGVAVVHRSGVFGSSNFLGNVSGGSNWITLHLECKR
jgi:outer membrane scaffolding protein for murein synthesis (MipA/OmpV family)